MTPKWEEWLIHWMSPKGPEELEKWIRGSFMKCHKDECKVLHLGRIYPPCSEQNGVNELGRCFVDMDLGDLNCGNESCAHTELD